MKLQEDTGCTGCVAFKLAFYSYVADEVLQAINGAENAIRIEVVMKKVLINVEAIVESHATTCLPTCLHPVTQTRSQQYATVKNPPRTTRQSQRPSGRGLHDYRASSTSGKSIEFSGRCNEAISCFSASPSVSDISNPARRGSWRRA